ncbi:hypothetical protein TWF696_000169 [Orbilia brochopaga]|uniref:Uncharacterized protein n=1 Tax=Orbilia brochopaga TaxID=3140254 RepID=A0AAV9VC29_9PEZI
MARRNTFTSILLLLALGFSHHINCQPSDDESVGGLEPGTQSGVVDTQVSDDQAPGLQVNNPLDEFDINVVVREGTDPSIGQISNPPINANPQVVNSPTLPNIEFSPEYLAQNQESIREKANTAFKELSEAQLVRMVANPGMYKNVEWGQTIDAIFISWDNWQDFLNALSIESKPDDNPIYFLLRDSKTIRTVLTQIDMIYRIMLEKTGKNSITIDNRYRGMIQRGWEIIRPLIDIDLSTSPEYNYGTYPAVIAPEALFNVTAKDLADPKLQAYTAQRIFRFEEISPNTYFASESQLIALWTLMTTVELELRVWINDFQNKIVLDVFRFPPIDQPKAPVGIDWPGTGRFKRQQIGYKEYFEEKFISEFNSDPLPPFSTTSKKDTEPWRSWRRSPRVTFDMYVQPLVLWTKIYSGLIPNMLEMLVDVASAANQLLGRKSIYPDGDFGAPFDSDIGLDAPSWLKSYPEWFVGTGKYVPDVNGFRIAKPVEQIPVEQVQIEKISVEQIPVVDDTNAVGTGLQSAVQDTIPDLENN